VTATPLLLFEVVRWGNDSDDVHAGGPNGVDTCFLVRAATVEAAAELADEYLSRMTSEQVSPWSHLVYLVGTDASTQAEPQVLRGPYFEHAYGRGWRIWEREEPGLPWVESRKR
jgi:hypothetical protein